MSEAVWRVLSAGGFGALTMRAVAAAMNASTGLLTHYFATKRELVRFALEVAEEQTQARQLRPSAGEGLAALRAALLDVLPPERHHDDDEPGVGQRLGRRSGRPETA